MYNKIVLYSLVSILAITFCQAQEIKSVNGVILDQKTGLPLQGVYVRTLSKTANAISNGSGSFTMTISGNPSIQDSIVIDALGYSRMVMPLSFILEKPILLIPTTYVLPDVTVGSYRVDWNDFMKKIGLGMRYGKLPFESEIQKSITVSTNLSLPKRYSFSGLTHSEGVTEEAFTSYLRGSTFWHTVVSSEIKDTTSFIGCNLSGKPEVFTEFERGKFQWLYKIYAIGREIAEYKIEAITQFGGDSVYIVNYLPKDSESNKEVRKLNSFSSNGIFAFFSLEKTYYVRKKDFRILRIDFVQKPGILSSSMKTNINKIHEISGSIGLEYFNETPHPVYVYENYLYQDINGNEIVRNDSCFFSNIKMEKLSDDELKKRYQIKNIYRSFPIRDVSLEYQEKLSPFWYVPKLK